MRNDPDAPDRNWQRSPGMVFNPDGTPMREGPSEPGDFVEEEIELQSTAWLKSIPEDDPRYERANLEYCKRLGLVET